MKNRALFLDRDGVINHLPFHEWGSFDVPHSTDQVELVEGIAEVIAWANQNSIPVFIVTNQPAHALGKMTLETLTAIEERILSLLKEQGALVHKVYRCLHHPDATLSELKTECTCRKPEPGLIHQARDEYNIDIERSVFVGDKITDMVAGEKAGCQTILYLHQNDVPHKVAAAYAYDTSHKVTNHKQTLDTLRALFDSKRI